MLLQVENLEVKYGNIQSLHGIDRLPHLAVVVHVQHGPLPALIAAGDYDHIVAFT